MHFSRVRKLTLSSGGMLSMNLSISGRSFFTKRRIPERLHRTHHPAETDQLALAHLRGREGRHPLLVVVRVELLVVPDRQHQRFPHVLDGTFDREFRVSNQL